jgi:DNA-binding LytR/AlgR family response regulator
MISCIIVEDEQHAVNLLKIHIEKISFIEIKAIFENPFDAITYLVANQVDVAFVDIQMPEMSGIELIKILKGKTNIIITSAYREFAYEGFENEVSDYLLKPISFEKILKATEKIYKQKYNHVDKIDTDEDFIVLKTDNKNKLIKLDVKDIVYIEGLKNYISVFTPQNRVISLLNIKAMEEQLPTEKFIRIHKSYIVSKNQIQSVDGNQVLLKDLKITLPLSDTYRSNFFKILRNRIIENKKVI